jgi:type IV conjugative transfer system protein TraE
MKYANYTSKLGRAIRERNVFLCMVGALFVGNIFQTGLCYKLYGQNKIIITPPTLNQDFWVEGNKVSHSYLQQMGDYFSRLMLNVTTASLEAREAAVLSMATENAYGNLKALLSDEADTLKKHGFTTTFNPIEYEVDVNNLSVKIKGELVIIQGRHDVKHLKKTYQIMFDNQGRGSKLLVKGFTDVTEAA